MHFISVCVMVCCLFVWVFLVFRPQCPLKPLPRSPLTHNLEVWAQGAPPRHHMPVAAFTQTAPPVASRAHTLGRGRSLQPRQRVNDGGAVAAGRHARTVAVPPAQHLWQEGGRLCRYGAGGYGEVRLCAPVTNEPHAHRGESHTRQAPSCCFLLCTRVMP